jgi:predicted secreted Zn-dependent protease
VSTTRILQLAIVLVGGAMLLAELRGRSRPAAPMALDTAAVTADDDAMVPALPPARELERALRRGRVLRDGRDGLEVTVIGRTYPVAGRTAEELAEVMTRDGPVVGGRQSYAKTHVQASTRLFSTAPGRCDPDSTRVELQLTVLLPEWRPPPAADPALRNHWTRFVRSTREHEMGHQDIARYYMSLLLTRARAETTADCLELQRALDGHTAQIYERHQATQDRLDEETREGDRPALGWPPEDR